MTVNLEIEKWKLKLILELFSKFGKGQWPTPAFPVSSAHGIRNVTYLAITCML